MNESGGSGYVIDDSKTKRLSEEQLAGRFGDRGLELARRLMPLSGKMGRVAYEELEAGSRPPAGDAFPEDDASMAVGWWLVLHHITVGNLGYSPREELRMHQ